MKVKIFNLLMMMILLIIGRHDVDKNEFLAIGEKYADSIVNLNLLPDTPDGMATFVSAEWLITAAHCAEVIDQRLKEHKSHFVEFRNQYFPVDTIIIHPAYASNASVDLALVHLSKLPEKPYEIYEVYAGEDELGSVVWIAGYGDIGNGKIGPLPNAAKELMGGTNRITEATDWWLKFIFDAPSDENATPLEAISGPGDSGGPAFIIQGESTYFAGVGSGQSTAATNGIEGIYGVKEYYVRLSKYHDWIYSQIE